MKTWKTGKGSGKTSERSARSPLSKAATALLAALCLASLACGDTSAGSGEPSASLTLAATRSATPSVAPSPSTPPSSAESEPAATAAPSEPPAPPDNADLTPAPEPLALPADAVSLLTVVDKQHALPADYEPPDLLPLGGAYVAPGFGGSLLISEAKGSSSACCRTPSTPVTTST
jgi:hypothetical protein